MSFELHPNLSKKIAITTLPLCSVFQEDERHYPWFILVPRVAGASKLIDLSEIDQIQLYRELNFIQKIIWKEVNPKQLNVAAIGNKTPQLHIHVIARDTDDPAWPNTVWDHPIRARFSDEEKQQAVERWRQAFSHFETVKITL